jgi:nucleoside-diphosphate-sugar epimerase
VNKVSHKKVFITGASGFVGCRLAERLVLGTDFQVLAGVHRFSGPGVARLGRLSLELVLADVLDPKALAEVAKDCDIIVHLAYGSRGDKKQKKEITVSGTKNVMEAALQAHVKKVIHVSTTAVHGLNPRGPLVYESASFERTNDLYRASKIEAEKTVRYYHQKHGLPVVIFRPPLVFGPYGSDWTVRIVKDIQAGAILVNGGQGAANLVYVDNLIDALMCAMEKDDGDGEAFFVVDDECLTWKDVYIKYAEMIGNHPPFLEMSAAEIEKIRKRGESSAVGKWVAEPFLLGTEMVKHSLRSPEIRKKARQIPWVKLTKDFIPAHIKDSLKGEKNKGEPSGTSDKSGTISIPNRDLVQLYSSKARFSNEKIKKQLGYQQGISFEEAMTLTQAWLRYQRIIPFNKESVSS